MLLLCLCTEKGRGKQRARCWAGEKRWVDPSGKSKLERSQQMTIQLLFENCQWGGASPLFLAPFSCSEFSACGEVVFFPPYFPIPLVYSCTSWGFFGFSVILPKPVFLGSFGEGHNKAWMAAVWVRGTDFPAPLPHGSLFSYHCPYSSHFLLLGGFFKIGNWISWYYYRIIES